MLKTTQGKDKSPTGESSPELRYSEGGMPSGRLMDHFREVPDYRVNRMKRHELIDILVIAILAIICGADEWTEIEEYGLAKIKWLKTFLKLSQGIPSHDTFGRVFARLNPEALQQAFLRWITAIQTITRGQVVALDGKTLRRSFDKAAKKGAIHMVSAWDCENRLVLGQVQVDGKSNEITAIPKLLQLLDLPGSTVTIDAMGCQKEIAAQIVQQGADYVLSLKGNQGTLQQDVELFFQDAQQRHFKKVPHQFLETIDGEHGRIETRRYYVVSQIDWLEGRQDWKDLRSIGMVDATRDVNGTLSREIRYFITSQQGDVKRFANSARGHWGIENSLHWTLDIAFREDDSRIRQGHAPANFALLHHIALNLLKQEKTLKRGVKCRRHKAGWDEDYLLKVLWGPKQI
jgi:predicted transposase YbfD/YdcC